MLWFLNVPKTNPNTLIEFYQIFVESNKVYSDEEKNIIYSFKSNNNICSKFNIDLSNHKSTDIDCNIKIIDNIISYDIINKNQNYVFTNKTNFINPQDNQYNIPIFEHIYKPISVKRLPNLIESKYTYTYKLNFQVYDILSDNNQVQFIVENNPLTNEKKKYFIVSNLNLMQKYYITNK